MFTYLPDRSIQFRYVNEWDKPTYREKFQNAGETLTWTVNGYCGAQGWRKKTLC